MKKKTDMQADDSSICKFSKIFLIVPASSLALMWLCEACLHLFPGPNDPGSIIYYISFSIWLTSFFLSPIPCLIFSAIGSGLMIHSVRAGAPKSAIIWIVLGVIEALLFIFMFLLSLYVLINGQGV